MIQFSFLLLSHNSILKHNSRLSRLVTMHSFQFLHPTPILTFTCNSKTRNTDVQNASFVKSNMQHLWPKKREVFLKKRNIIVHAINLVGAQQEMSRGLVSHIYHVSYLHVNLRSRNTKYYYCKCSIRRNNESRRCFIIIFLRHLRGPASLKIMFS